MMKDWVDRPCVIEGGGASRRLFLRRGFAAAVAAALGPALMPAFARAGDGYEARLADLGLRLPDPPSVSGQTAWRVSGETIYVPGQLAFKEGRLMHPGRVPGQVSMEQAGEAATQCVLNMLSVLKSACGGDLDRLQTCLRLEVFLASDESFGEHPEVMDEASRLVVDVLGDVGRHWVVAYPIDSLPFNASVQVAGVFTFA